MLSFGTEGVVVGGVVVVGGASTIVLDGGDRRDDDNDDDLNEDCDHRDFRTTFTVYFVCDVSLVKQV